MPKALVIKGADFSANKITTVVISDPVPCTSISLDISTKSLTSMTAFTLTATVTPNNTTDVIVWSSSDPTVATVSNGTVTPLKLGTTTITATCGSYSATCTVTIDNVVQDYVAISGYYPVLRSSTGNALTISGNTTGETSNYFILAVDSDTGYEIENKTSSISGYIDTSPYRFVPIKIPAGAKKIIVGVDSTIAPTYGKMKTATQFTDSSSQATYSGNTKGVYCVQGGNGWDQGSTVVSPVEIEIPDNTRIDSVCLGVTVADNSAIHQDYASHISLVFSSQSVST